MIDFKKIEANLLAQHKQGLVQDLILGLSNEYEPTCFNFKRGKNATAERCAQRTEAGVFIVPVIFYRISIPNFCKFHLIEALGTEKSGKAVDSMHPAIRMNAEARDNIMPALIRNGIFQPVHRTTYDQIAFYFPPESNEKKKDKNGGKCGEVMFAGKFNKEHNAPTDFEILVKIGCCNISRKIQLKVSLETFREEYDAKNNLNVGTRQGYATANPFTLIDF